MTQEPNIIGGILIVILYVGAILAILIINRLERLLTRYRIKYGFDREIESKEMSGKEEDKPERLNRRERMFKRRVFKD